MFLARVKTLVPPFPYQGGKQRLSKEICTLLYNEWESMNEPTIYDMCCGAGSVTLELVNMGVEPESIVMVDSSTVARFYCDIADGSFSVRKFRSILSMVPDNQAEIKEYMEELSRKPCYISNRSYIYVLLQNCSFGGKQIYYEDGHWKNATFRRYWEPTETSNRRSPVIAMPQKDLIYKKTSSVVNALTGRITAYNKKVEDVLKYVSNNSLVYIDPPYKGTTGYSDNIDYYAVIKELLKKKCVVYLSEGYQHSKANHSICLTKGQSKGNISGEIKKKPTQEWVNIFKL